MPASELEALIQIISRLPGLGPRSARRVALHLIRHRETLMVPLGAALIQTADAINQCQRCSNYDTVDPCHICTDPRRDDAMICVVEDLSDLWAMERSGLYRGRYHILGGTLSAIDARGPEQLGIDKLVTRAQAEEVTEIILATNATVDGQTTAHYLTESLKGCNVAITRLAQGIPMGGELDYLDDGTLGNALRARLPFG